MSELGQSMSFADNKLDLPGRNFLNPEFRIYFQREVPLFL